MKNSAINNYYWKKSNFQIKKIIGYFVLSSLNKYLFSSMYKNINMDSNFLYFLVHLDPASCNSMWAKVKCIGTDTINMGAERKQNQDWNGGLLNCTGLHIQKLKV